MRNINYNAMQNYTNQPVTLDNESTLDAAAFSDAAPATSAAIALDAHFISSGIKLDIEIFPKGNIKKMVDKETTDTTPAPESHDADTPDTYAQDSGSTDSNSPY